jgi:hypothetical protein
MILRQRQVKVWIGVLYRFAVPMYFDVDSGLNMLLSWTLCKVTFETLIPHGWLPFGSLPEYILEVPLKSVRASGDKLGTHLYSGKWLRNFEFLLTYIRSVPNNKEDRFCSLINSSNSDISSVARGSWFLRCPQKSQDFPQMKFLKDCSTFI